MIEQLFSLHRRLVGIHSRQFKRYFLKKHTLSNRFSIIMGQRGVGKTPAMIQHINTFVKGDTLSTKALYVPVDHISVVGLSLYDIAEEFVNNAGKLLCLDEIHKYQNWSRELKSIYDTFPDLNLIVSGSSAMEIHKGSHDLSRRAVILKMTGLSLREFIGLKHEIDLQAYNLGSILKNHESHSLKIVDTLAENGLKILPVFKEYLESGYFPYFLEHLDQGTYWKTLEQGIQTTIESDLLAIYPNLTGVSIKKLNLLLSTIAGAAPFTPDMRRLKQIIEVGDERTLKTYLKYLEDGRIITCLSKRGKSLKRLEKPEKIYLNNPNQAYAICNDPNSGSLRELFFASMLQETHHIAIPPKGDFIIDDQFVFEVGGKGKTFQQIKGLPDSFLALDDIEHGFNAKIPLWMFGFVY